MSLRQSGIEPTRLGRTAIRAVGQNPDDYTYVNGVSVSNMQSSPGGNMPRSNSAFQQQQPPMYCLNEQECEQQIKPYKKWTTILAALFVIFFLITIVFLIISAKKKKQ